MVGMVAWILLAFVAGAAAGGAGVWLWLSRRPAPAVHPTRPLRLDRDAPAEVELDGMSKTAQRLVTDLERKYEGVRSAPDEVATSKRARPRRGMRPPPS